MQQIEVGKTSCTLTSPGEYVSVNAATYAIKCAPGTANNQFQQTSCPACTPGFFSPMAGAIGLHTDQKCANGHGLIRFKTPRDGFGCDLCSQSIPIDTVMYGCNECNYDICVSCEENTLGERKQDDAVAEFGKTLDMKLQEKYVEEENDNINSYGSNGIIEGERYRLTGLKSDGYNGKIGQCGKWHSTQKRYRFLI